MLTQTQIYTFFKEKIADKMSITGGNPPVLYTSVTKMLEANIPSNSWVLTLDARDGDFQANPNIRQYTDFLKVNLWITKYTPNDNFTKIEDAQTQAKFIAFAIMTRLQKCSLEANGFQFHNASVNYIYEEQGIVNNHSGISIELTFKAPILQNLSVNIAD